MHFDRDARGAARASPRHGVRGGGLPEYRRVLGQAPRHLHADGRHLHAGLRLLQCAHRESPARSMPSEPSRVAQAVAALGLAHVVVTSVDRDDLDDGGAAHFAATVRAIRAARPDDQHRSADAGLSAQGGRARHRARRPRPTCSTTMSRPCPRSTGAFVRGPIIATRSICSRAPRRSTRGFSPSRASWSGLARRATRCSR